MITAQTGLSRVTQLVKDLLAFSRTNGQLDSATAPRADLNEALDAAFRIIGPAASTKARVERRIPELPQVVGQRSRLAQVFLNLLLNAVQAIEDGHPERNFICVSAELMNGGVVVRVTDSGHGIKPELVGRVFEPFFTTQPAGFGTGIGLAFCKEVVESYGGSVRVLSNSPSGVSMELRLQVAQSS